MVRCGRNRGRSRRRVEPTGPHKQRGGSWFQSSWDRGQGALRGMDRAPPFPHSVGAVRQMTEGPQVYESMCNILAQAGLSETAQTSDKGPGPERGSGGLVQSAAAAMVHGKVSSPDGGWGWVIVGCCFMVTVCTRAVTR
eukprot:superscaffoldBa00008651_g23524